MPVQEIHHSISQTTLSFLIEKKLKLNVHSFLKKKQLQLP